MAKYKASFPIGAKSKASKSRKKEGTEGKKGIRTGLLPQKAVGPEPV